MGLASPIYIPKYWMLQVVLVVTAVALTLGPLVEWSKSNPTRGAVSLAV